MSHKEGSAAVDNPFSTPESAERKTLQYCLYRLRHTLTVAEIAATGAEPERAAWYVVETVEELDSGLRSLRESLTRLPAPS